MSRPKPRLTDLSSVKRRPMPVPSTGGIRRRLMDANPLPLVIEPDAPGVDLVAWSAAARPAIEQDVRQHGAILFRGFDIASPDRLQAFIRAVSGEPFEYKERSSPRLQVQGQIYTSTEYPPHHEIFFHNENSYAHTWPRKLFFCCATAPMRGGETPIVDVRGVHARIPADVRERFERLGVLYVRNYSDRLGLSWRTVFQTEDRDVADAYARASGYVTEWRDGRLRTRRLAPVIYRHPETGEHVWFNHAAFFHLSTLDPLVQDGLRAQFAEEDLPNQTFFGDGSPIAPEIADTLRRAYRDGSVAFAWQTGDLLMLDNMLVAHARAPFDGPRRVLVGMSEPCHAESIEKTEAAADAPTNSGAHTQEHA